MKWLQWVSAIVRWRLTRGFHSQQHGSHALAARCYKAPPVHNLTSALGEGAFLICVARISTYPTACTPPRHLDALQSAADFGIYQERHPTALLPSGQGAHPARTFVVGSDHAITTLGLSGRTAILLIAQRHRRRHIYRKSRLPLDNFFQMAQSSV